MEAKRDFDNILSALWLQKHARQRIRGKKPASMRAERAEKGES
jgi:hypothetical protein